MGVCVIENWGYIDEDAIDTEAAKPTAGIFNNVEDAVITILESHGIKV